MVHITVSNTEVQGHPLLANLNEVWVRHTELEAHCEIESKRLDKHKKNIKKELISMKSNLAVLMAERNPQVGAAMITHLPSNKCLFSAWSKTRQRTTNVDTEHCA